MPLTFDWPLHRVWGGYMNSYAAQSANCPDCVSGYDRAGGRPNANATLFRAQWYGDAPFDPAAYAGSGQVWPSPEIRQKYEDWERKGPPTGDGYQPWENVSEGSPISPVFATLDELCAWPAKHATTFAGFRATQEEWRSMLDGGVVHARVGSNILT